MQIDAHCVIGFAMLFGCITVCDSSRFSDNPSLSIFREDNVDMAKESIHNVPSGNLT